MSLDMISVARALYAKGFAIHWLHPRSKRPIEKGWTTGNRKSFTELKRLYQKGMNIGVRLGEPSRISVIEGEGLARSEVYYLAVIDCDVKSTQEKHLREMDQKVRSLFPGIHKAAIVASGRGNGSRHYYVVTKEPVSPKRLAQSGEKVRVKMPSAQPSRHERDTMEEVDLARGWRLRPAWEISLMGQGNQVVLPPSVHPDSGKRYEWSREWQKPYVLNWDAPAEEENEDDDMGLTAVSVEGEIDLKARGVSEKIIAMIEDGDGVEDRSGALFKVAMELLKAGLSDTEVVHVLTDKKTFLGKAAYDHAKTTNRERAGKWIIKYTLPKAKRESDPGVGFDEPPPEKLKGKAKKKQAAEFKETLSSSWDAKIERSEHGKVKGTLKNLTLILENAVDPMIFRHNEFAASDIYGAKAPWGGKVGAEIRDIDSLNIKMWFAQKWLIEPNTNLVNEAISFIARKNNFNPVRDYLDGLKWDGVERIDTWLKDYLSAKAPEPYLSAVSRKMLVAMVARAYEPGKKFDQVVILQGEQGKRKSTALEALAGEEWFSDATLNLADKDSVLSMRSIWLRELGELSGMRKADTEQMKEFISRRTDRIRVPYGKRTEAFPRQCIFVGSTNKDEFLKDDTGNRRFWPVLVGRCDVDRIAEDRDQLFAEAKLAWELGEPLYLEDTEAEAIAVKEQGKRMESDTVTEYVQRFIREDRKKPKDERFNFRKFQLSEAFDKGIFVTLRDDRTGQLRAASALRALGFTKKLSRSEDGKVGKYWFATLKEG